MKKKDFEKNSLQINFKKWNNKKSFYTKSDLVASEFHTIWTIKQCTPKAIMALKMCISTSISYYYNNNTGVKQNNTENRKGKTLPS